MAVGYKQTTWAEMKPDLYHGAGCNEVKPLFECYTEGDMDSEPRMEKLTFMAADYPPGTKIIVLEPTCPSCELTPELCGLDSECEFDWDNWRDGEYS